VCNFAARDGAKTLSAAKTYRLISATDNPLGEILQGVRRKTLHSGYDFFSTWNGIGALALSSLQIKSADLTRWMHSTVNGEVLNVKIFFTRCAYLVKNMWLFATFR
jgi:hypothetical protein